MTLSIPQLDDIEFTELVEIGRAQIPRYAPEWTDHNLHDPGITLIDLIAFLVDQQIYRIGFVGDSLRVAFTRLLGITPRGPEEAQMLVWPMPEVPLLDLKHGTPIDSPDIPEARYTLDEDIRVVAARIRDIAVVNDTVTRSLGTGLAGGRDPQVLLPYSGGGPRALDLRFEPAIAPMADTGWVSLGVIVDGPRIDEPGQSGWQDLMVEQWQDGDFWRPLKVLDRTGGLSRSGVILFRPDPSAPLTRLRLRLDRGFRPGIVTVTRLALNVLPAREGFDDLEQGRPPIGHGTEQPDQAVVLQTDDILQRDMLKVLVDSEGETITFQIVPDFANSGPNDAHVVLTETGLLFGNGLNGRMIPKGAVVRYGDVRRTEGAGGAVAKGLRWRVARAVFGTNLLPSTAGRNRDRLSDLARRARRVVGERLAKVSDADIVASLQGQPLGLADIRVLPRRRPGLENADAPGSRTVLILPVRDPATLPHPPSPRLRDAVERALSPLRLLGERIHVSQPCYRAVDVTAHLVVAADADPAAVCREAEALLRARLWDLRRNPLQEVQPWPAGRPVEPGEIEGIIAALKPVLRIPVCTVGQGGAQGTDPILLDDREIALARTIAITVEREWEGGRT